MAEVADALPGPVIEWEPLARDAVAAVEKLIEPRLKRVGEDLYSDLLYAVQDYLLENVLYNVKQQIAAADRQSRLDRQRLTEVERERDAARGYARALERAVRGADLSQLLSDVLEFVADQADADGNSDGFTPNTAMRLQMATEAALRAFGWEA